MAEPPTEEERAILQQFKDIVADLDLRDDEKTDMALLRWLRARDLDLNQADVMLRRSSQWRMENDIYNITKWNPPNEFWTNYYYEICGTAICGCPVLAVEIGRWDVKKASESALRESWLKYNDLMFAKLDEQMQKSSQRLGACISQFVVVVDVGDFSMRQITSVACVNTIREVVRRYEANYPETLKTCFIVNASRVFRMLFSIIKPLLTARTLAKLQVYGTNEEEWKHMLLKDIPASQLSIHFGGTYVPSFPPGPDAPGSTSAADTYV